MNRMTIWTLITVLELLIAIVVVVRDLFLPTIVILALAAISLLIRRQGPSSLGFKRPASWGRMALTVLLTVLALNLLELGLVMPVLNRLTGTHQDVSQFANLKGNLPELLMYLALTWSLAAFGEEMVYRGYLQRRLMDLFGTQALATCLAIGLTSLLFGLAHTEQGIIGVALTTLDAVVFSLLKKRFDGNLWASILAHGFSNSIGLIAFFFAGPIYGLW